MRLTCPVPTHRRAPRFSRPTQATETQGRRHEDPQLAEIAERASSRQSRDPSPRPHLRHQQDEPPLQGAPGLKQGLRAVVFDVGNVLYRWDPAAIYRDEEPARARRFLDEAATFAWHAQHDAGRPFSETSAELAAAHPHYADLIARWRSGFGDSLTPVDGMAALVDALAARGVPLYAITNFSAEFWAPFRLREAALFDRFAGILVSGEERLVKPDPAIFALARARFALGVGEGLFVDDLAGNVAAAEAGGFAGHLFEDAGRLRAVLEAGGLL